MTLVEAIMAFGGGGLVTGAGVKIFDALARRGGDVAKTVVREGTRRKIAKVKLTGDAQADIAKVTEWALENFKEARDDTDDLQAEVHQLRAENTMLKDAFDKMKAAREDSLRENIELVRQVTSLIEQAKILGTKLAAKEMELARLSIEHEGAKARIEAHLARVAAQEKMIADMQSWLDDATAREAKLEAENERLRAGRALS